MTGNVPAGPQSAALAEHMAGAVACALCPPAAAGADGAPVHLPGVIYTDCMAVLTAHRKMPGALGHRGSGATCWVAVQRQTHGGLPSWQNGRFVKTKAHRTQEVAAAHGDLAEFPGHEAADRHVVALGLKAEPLERVAGRDCFDCMGGVGDHGGGDS